MTDDPDTVWLTYEEAATKLGIKPDSVRRRAASRKWPRRKGNDNKARVGIPADVIPDRTPDATHDVTPDSPDPARDSQAEISGLKATVDGLEKRLADTQKDRDRLVTLLEKALEPKPGLIERIGRIIRR